MKEAFATVILFIGAFSLGYVTYPEVNQPLIEPVAPRELVPEVGKGKTFMVGTNTVQWINNPEQIEAAFLEADKTLPTPDGLTRTGLAIYNTKECTVYAYEPADVNDRERIYVLGHEILHCFRGDYHK